MEKIQYEKPELIEIELNEEIILASGSFCGDDDCSPDQCGADDCPDYCLDDFDCPDDCGGVCPMKTPT